ncbi:MAG TPA: MotA/TolQ/ExbB proton channel family protein [Azospira sp.]|nr:MotA/TolQ/ExbB proton channel family protein [Accumulibacter sp.]HNN45721.1 MotA/TolQ/ExbB proton channel family protein [Azospira sp.]
MEQGLGFAHFVTQTDAFGKTVLVLLLLLSIASWYLILTRAVSNWLDRRRAEAYQARSRAARSLDDLAHETGNPLAALVAEALAVQRAAGGRELAAAGGFGEVLTRSLNNAIDQEMTRAEHGLTTLATAGSAAPYIGLFGTVWGIYHALVQIGMSGQGTLDKVAGPVGEALIMTALGLAVAIPAVLAYNAFQRRNRMWLSRLESFAHELYLLLTVRHGQG